MNRQNQSLAFASLFAQISAPLLAVAALLLSSDRLMAQAVVDTLPPHPPVNLAKERSPALVFTPREFDFKAPVASPPSTNQESYLVYVNEASSPMLQEVRQLEPTAFMRQYNGRSVIQAGVFNKNSNAQHQAKALQSRGIEARIVNLATGEQTEFAGSKSYFVVIPANREDLPLIENKVKQLPIDSASISQREEPRGSHVRVGPFTERGQAERLNRYIVDSGLRNARVYYGR